MKNKTNKSFITFGLASFAAVVILLVGCSWPIEEKSTKTTEAAENFIDAKKELDVAQKNYDKMYREFRSASDNKIVENEKTIARLKAEARSDKQEAKADLEKKLTALEQKNQLLKEEIRDYKESDLSKWESFKIEFNREMESLDQSLKDLTKKDAK